MTYFVQTVSFKNPLLVKKKKLNCLSKHNLVERNVIPIYVWFIYDYYFPKITTVKVF